MEWADWESGDTVHVPDPTWPKGHVEPGELARRVATNFRRVSFDWIEGDRWAETRYEKWNEVSAHQAILDAERGLFENTALVSITDDPAACQIRFFLTPDTGLLELNYDPPSAVDAGRALGRKLAQVLGYTFTAREEDEAASV